MKHRRRPVQTVLDSLGVTVLVALVAAAACQAQTVVPARPGAQATPPEQGKPIGQVLTTGTSSVTEGYVKTQLRTRVGQPYDQRIVQEDIRQLLRSGRFDNAFATQQLVDDKVVVTFVLMERPRVRSLQFEGNKAFTDQDLMAEVDFGQGEALDPFRVNSGRTAIEQVYKSKGYNYVTVTVDEQAMRDQSMVVYRVVEGPQVRVRSVRFEGNRAISSRRLARQVRTKPHKWVLSEGRYDLQQVQRDTDALIAFCRGEGYLDARITPRVEFRADRRDLDLTFLIAEGPRFSVRSIQFEGNTVCDEGELFGLLKVAVGMPYRAEVVRTDVRSITDRYGTQGYIDVVVAPSWVYAAEDTRVDLTYSITEGQQSYVGRILIRGNQVTQDRVVRRELRLYPGEPYDRPATRRAEQRLTETMLFSDVRITPLGDEPGVRDVMVEVAEAQTTTLLFGIGVTSNSGVIGNISMENRNFNLMGPPKSFSELFTNRAFKGAGQRLKMQFEPGTELTRGRIDFREPYLLDMPVSLGVSAYLFQRGRTEYDEQRGGGAVSLGRRFQRGPLKGWIGELAARVDSIDISGLDFWTSRPIRKDAGASLLTTLKGSLVRDRTDSRFQPSRGDRVVLAIEQAGAMGGDHTFTRLSAGYWLHHTVRTDVLDRKSILSIRARAAYIAGDAPVFERFYAGGIGSARGFTFRGISPRAGIRDDRIGGDFMLMTGAEYSFPVYGRVLRGVVFTDMGTVEEDFEITTWRASAGVGLRIIVQYFGPIPLSFDFALPLTKDEKDDTQTFSFSLGATF